MFRSTFLSNILGRAQGEIPPFASQEAYNEGKGNAKMCKSRQKLMKYTVFLKVCRCKLLFISFVPGFAAVG
jgi:hypothetical protein